MPFSPPLLLEAGSGTKFQLFPLFNIVGPFFGSNQELGGASSCVLSSLLSVGGMKTITIGEFKSKLYKNILSGMYILLLRT
jgi:hypothetical protein